MIFESIYKFTLAKIRAQSDQNLITDFLEQDLGWHFFSAFLRTQRKQQIALHELAQLEWIYFELKREGQRPVFDLKDSAAIKLNPMAKWIHLTSRCLEFDLAPGVWLFKLGADLDLQTRPMRREQAEIIDLLGEGLVLTKSELQQALGQQEPEVLALALGELTEFGVVLNAN